MRIVIDMQGMQTHSRLRGIGRYTVSFVKEILKNNNKKHEFILVLNGQFPETIEEIRSDFDDLLPQQNIRVWESLNHTSALESTNTWRMKASMLIREAFIESLFPDFILITTLFEGFDDDFIGSVHFLENSIPTAVILYDLIPLMNKDKYLADTKAYEWYMQKIDFSKKAELLLAISESARQEAIKYLNIKKQNVINISTASNSVFTERELNEHNLKALKDKFGVNREIIMFSGATDERKNLPRLIEAYSILSSDLRKKYQLVFVGGLPELHKSHFASHAKVHGLEDDDLVMTGRVSDDEMSMFYNIATVFIFPSWHEGFGLPALEAMSSGCAVIVSNTSSLPEVVGLKDALFDPFDVESIALKMEQVLEDETFRVLLEEHGLEQSKKFSWKITANHAVKAIENYVKDKDSLNIEKIDKESSDRILLEQIFALDTVPNDIDINNIAFAISQNRLTDTKQLFIDVSELVISPNRNTGIQRVVRGVLKELLLNPPRGYQVEPIYAGIEADYHYARKFKNEFMGLDSKATNDELIEFNYNDIFLGLDLVHVKVLKENFYQYLRKHGVKVYFILYDLLPIQFPLYTEEVMSQSFHKWLHVVCQSDGVVCISKDVSDNLKTYIEEEKIDRLRPLEISWFHIGINDKSDASSYDLLSKDDKVVLKTIEKHITFLMVGTIEPRKGHIQVLEAFEKLWKDNIDINLVIVGKEGWLMEKFTNKLNNHEELDKRLFWLDGISDEYLEKVYEASTCLIAASEGEGFGLPLIEAAQYKLPVIARDMAVFREVAGKYAYYFENDKNPLVIENAIKDWIGLYETNQHPLSDDMPWFTWEESTNQLLKCLKIDNKGNK